MAVSSPSALATTDQDIMRHALTGYATTIARRLRRKQLQATVLTASASTSCYSEGPGHHPYISQGFLQPTADTERIATAAHRLLPQLRPGVRYAHATLMLTGLLDAGTTPGSTRPARVAGWGGHGPHRGPLRIHSDRLWPQRAAHAPPSCTMHRQMQSPRYTTC
ncbi:DinB/UmuC family translesion DNA polymerase [Mycobacteroides abscessus]|uniref:DinB/UmuC family translesion DNA polymerase n=1 Tax=Mycobacteroides abscessus TaxID=36809 RepID=UPI0009A5CBEA|nr:hypothetical protein [Mycobacteroides abscessus]